MSARKKAGSAWRLNLFCLKCLVWLAVTLGACLRDELASLAASWIGGMALGLARQLCAMLHEHKAVVFRSLDWAEVAIAATLVAWLAFARASFCRGPVAVYCGLVSGYYGLKIWAHDPGEVVARLRGTQLREQLYLGMSLCLIWIAARLYKRGSLFTLCGALAAGLCMAAQLPGVDPRIVTLNVSFLGAICAGASAVALWPNLSASARACAAIYVIGLAFRPAVIWSDDVALNLVYGLIMLLKFYVIIEYFSANPPRPSVGVLLAGRTTPRPN